MIKIMTKIKSKNLPKIKKYQRLIMSSLNYNKAQIEKNNINIFLISSKNNKFRQDLTILIGSTDEVIIDGKYQ
jgi:hypothetical protein